MGEEVSIATKWGQMPTYVALPGQGAGPGVVLIHDAFGMTPDIRRQSDWLAGEGFLSAAPDLYYWGNTFRCVRSTLRDAVAGQGRAFEELDAVRAWLTQRPDCTGKVGVIGFCMGGGFALLLAPGHGYSASSVNYGRVPEDAEDVLAGACPIVASYGGKDRQLRGAARRLGGVLTAHQISHDVREYPDASHSFLNDHHVGEIPLPFFMLMRVTGIGLHEPSAEDARRRIAAFFHRYLD